MKEKLEKAGSFMITLLLLSVATVIGWTFRVLHFPETNIVIVYILSVVLTARFTKGHVYGIMVFPKQKDIKKQPMFTCLQTKEYCY